jgi:hypothetical protein
MHGAIGSGSRPSFRPSCQLNHAQLKTLAVFVTDHMRPQLRKLTPICVWLYELGRSLSVDCSVIYLAEGLRMLT